MAILKIARLGAPVLRQVAEPVVPDRLGDPDLQRLIDDMLETLEDSGGVGLAAPQVHRSSRLVVLGTEPGEPPRVMVNPELTWRTAQMVRSYEGCLSVPGLRGAVNRVASLTVQGLDRAGEPFSLDLEGFAAIAVQHEVDHLDGVLYLDRCDTRTLAFTEELARYGPLDPSFHRRQDPEDGPEPGAGEPSPEVADDGSPPHLLLGRGPGSEN